MRRLSFRKAVLFFLVAWTFWIVGNLMNPTPERGVIGSAFAGSDQTTDGVGVYRQFCVNCHAANGKGDDNMKKVMTTMPDFTSDKWQKETSDPQISVSITDGKGTLMPAFADKVNADQVQALVEYVRKFDPSRAK